MRLTRLLRTCALLFAVLVGLSVSCAASAATPSFLCSKSKTWVEKSICASDRLSELDLELAVARAHMLDVLSGDAQKAFNAEHGKWWANLAQCRKDKDPPSCLEGRYEARISELKSRPDYPGDEPRPREQQFSEALIKEAGKGWSQNMSAYMKAIRACSAKPSPRPRAVLSVWTEEEGDLVMMRLRGVNGEDVVCFAKRDGTDASLRKRDPAETLPEEGPILWLGSGPAPKEACGKPVQVLDTDDTPVGWVADAKC
jgi:uncharacterized protein